ncbi:hypothetical protein Q0590_37295 [Rhodocytophaga aerolata]|uniref:Uncharacterized protein n=1 Tax=Rhodocytophaga aerolata TaxID=455078 RepID=A0ABT8RIS2_9BACT|nr:hypothetical protein [Rhodocytophaga aerolata]MDO1451985.1 hypothetical protein [Rhodocytophaga aerolata]
MKKLILLLLFASFSSVAQTITRTEKITEQTTYVAGKGFEGVIFSADYPAWIGSSERFTPTLEEIVLVENLLKSSLKEVNKPMINQGSYMGPVIHKRLHKYQRQYFGYISPKGERMVYVNCNYFRYNFIDRIQGIEQPDDKWKKQQTEVNDGGSYHWQIQVNLTTKELFGLQVNGVA